MKFPMPRTRKGQWLAVVSGLALVLCALLALRRDYATLDKYSAVNMRPVPHDTRGTTLGWMHAGSRVQVLGVLMAPDPEAQFINGPAAMVEVRADCGDMRAMHGWIEISSFDKNDGLRLFRKYHPWTR